MIKDSVLESLKNIGLVVVLESKNTCLCKGYIMGRIAELLPDIMEECLGYDLIIYDLMSPEGKLAGEVLNIKTICVEPSYIVNFDISSEEYLSENDISIIETRYNIKFANKLKLISGNLSLLSDKNILFSWKKLIDIGGFKSNEMEFYFMRPFIENIPELIGFEHILNKYNKIVYFSLGTIAPGIAWDEFKASNLQGFISLIYNIIIDIFIDRNDYALIISSGRNINDIINSKAFSSNIYVFESVPQDSLLYHVDLFITHCGANSINEAIHAEVPMIGLPLIFDQHQAALSINKLNIGHSFNCSEETNTDKYYREPFYLENISNATKILGKTIDDIINKDYSNSFSYIKSHQDLYFNNIHKLIAF